ncbi:MULTISPECIES: rhomboid family intramembrane serine protease [Hymenobacter]|uniref:Rhomboid family intramembrane serine protease n=1 Tax=Hymenobacter profundi TaxID=1982110 RepID=A0ABS6X445_9BACT|nr:MULTISPECIES: rhomboid family intramembrane serine protease [Hymenobacter]MBW3130247.1 rhomboid family intramembrane serine protease [Hymenobacter profundi]QNE38468.1 rhomboid family intramembrane serine protease [Hymenobacter sp. NBH84]
MFNLTPAVRNILLINVLVFVAQQVLGDQTIMLALFPVGSPNYQPWQFLTYMFMHGGFMHILFNMFALISFGPLLEMQWGANRFLTFWLICGVGAGVLYSGVRYYELDKMNQARMEFRQDPSSGNYADFFRTYLPEAEGYRENARILQESPTPANIAQATENVDGIYNQSFNVPMLGASGAVFGILMAFAYLFPNTELMLLFIPFPIKAKYMVFGYAAFELIQGVYRVPGDTVAHFAHLGGMLIGFIVLKIWERSRGQFY